MSLRYANTFVGSLAVFLLAVTARAQLDPPVVPSEGYDSYQKNRYLTVDASAGGANTGLTFSISVTLTDSLQFEAAEGTSWWVGAPDQDCIAGLTNTEVLRTWDGCPVLHITDCGIIPVSEYSVVLTDDQDASTAPVSIFTAPRPGGSKWWADAVGNFDPGDGLWTPPQGIVAIEDAVAGIRTFQNPNASNATHVSITDIHPQIPNRLINIDDVFKFLEGFRGIPYPFGCPSDPCQVSPCS